MNLTRKRVYRAVRELSRSGERVTYYQIAARADCSYMTVRRAIPELIREGKIICSNTGKGYGYYYEVVKCQP
ncbi:MAG: HTH domain-containing protein [Chloroflexi bacterium]|nr:HTH domain-containing protein [Chloroflexota bacterium]